MENEILDIIKKMIYEDLENEAYENRYKAVDFPTTINLIPNFKVITDFNNYYFEKYKQTLVTNSVVYSIENNKTDFLNFLKKYINDLNKTLDNINLFKAKTTEFAILNIITKCDKIGNTLLFNVNSNRETINNNKSLFDKLNNNFISIMSFTYFYKSILFNYLKQFSQTDRDDILDIILTTDEKDKEFIEFSNGIIPKNRIILYKYFIIRSIISDNYLYVTTARIENELNNYLQSINENENKFDDFKKEYDSSVDKQIYEYIDDCIQDNKYILPKDDTLKFNMYIRFLAYSELNSKEYDIETIEGSPDDLKKLKLINPFYKLDLINPN